VEKFTRVVCHQVDLTPLPNLLQRDRLPFRFERKQITRRQQVYASEIEVRVWRRKAVEVGAADRREQERIRVFVENGIQQVMPNHAPYSGEAAARRASMRNSFARAP
jgi:hypothetical protein